MMFERMAVKAKIDQLYQEFKECCEAYSDVNADSPQELQYEARLQIGKARSKWAVMQEYAEERGLL